MKGIDPDYLDFYKLELVAGRNIESTKKEFTEFIVNEKLIEALGWTPEQAVGKKIKINEGEATIIGVVRNFHNNSLQEELTPCVFVNWSYFLEVADCVAISAVNYAWQPPDGVDYSEAVERAGARRGRSAGRPLPTAGRDC